MTYQFSDDDAYQLIRNRIGEKWDKIIRLFEGLLTEKETYVAPSRTSRSGLPDIEQPRTVELPMHRPPALAGGGCYRKETMTCIT